jgi:hypothetical protein
LVGGIVFGTMALLGLRGSPWWLAAGWALHPLWDAGLHYFGPGSSFAPEPYAIACISFDWLVAAYIVVVYGLGLLSPGTYRRSDKAPIGAESERTALTATRTGRTTTARRDNTCNFRITTTKEAHR